MGVRLPNWPVLVTRSISDARETPFEWGAHDCCLGACNVIRDFTGRDPAIWFRGRYSTQGGAYRALRKYLAETGAGPIKRADLLPPVVERLCMVMGYGETTRNWLSTGDVALVGTPECAQFPTALGIIAGPRVFVTGEDKGFKGLPIEEVIRGWKV